jgi:hypothetical protein
VPDTTEVTSFSTGKLRVSRLFRYPVKSMLGEPLEAAYIDRKGIPGDRAYALRDAVDGTIASAKNPKKWGRLLEFRATHKAAPTRGALPPPVAISFPDGTVHESSDPTIHERLSHAIGREVHLIQGDVVGAEKELELVWASEGLSPQEAVDRSAIGTQGDETLGRGTFGTMSPADRYFDYSVLHVITTATLRQFQQLAPDASFDVRRFRPNIVLATDGQGFIENTWVGQTLAIGELRVRVILNALRCVMITLAQDGLGRDRGVLRAVAAHNRLEIGAMGRWACAGVFADVFHSGQITAGASARLIDTPPDEATPIIAP